MVKYKLAVIFHLLKCGVFVAVVVIAEDIWVLIF